jgi:predicted nucleotidyltransferase
MTQKPAGTREEVLARLTKHRGELAQASLALFGSAAGSGLDAKSDVDMLVTFAGAATFDGYMNLEGSLRTCLAGASI